eukprot:5642555-Ditylum_brightwellii.AAC.1
MRNEWDDISGSETVAYFYDEFIGMSTLGKDNKSTRIVLVNVIYLALTQAVIVSCVSFDTLLGGHCIMFDHSEDGGDEGHPLCSKEKKKIWNI